MAYAKPRMLVVITRAGEYCGMIGKADQQPKLGSVTTDVDLGGIVIQLVAGKDFRPLVMGKDRVAGLPTNGVEVTVRYQVQAKDSEFPRSGWINEGDQEPDTINGREAIMHRYANCVARAGTENVRLIKHTETVVPFPDFAED